MRRFPMSANDERAPKPTPSWLARATAVLSLGPRAWSGAAYGLLMAGAVLWFGIFLSAPPTSAYGWGVNLTFAVVLGTLSVMLGHLVVALLTHFQKLPLPYRWLLVGVVVLLFLLLRTVLHLIPNVVAMIALVVVTASLVGAGLGALARGRLEPARRRVAWSALALSGVALVGFGAWVLWPGPRYQVPLYATAPTSVPTLNLADPAQPGDYRVLTLSYGSGTDRHRPAYGEAVDIVTRSVDVSGMVGGYSGPIGWLRRGFWGFDLTEAPLNAQVWYPDSEGPFPLVLVVHGNHTMDDFSEGGYDYLGELLASRGFIVASVDQNFLNAGGMIEAVLGGLREENDARGYLLLEHLRLWHAWNETAGHAFHGKVDTDKIALIGHSRGGEAAAIAAAFNRLPTHPDSADIRFDFNYAIRAVVAMAPSDGQYRPRRQGTPLDDVNYLVLQGAADGDVRSFQGAGQYDRVRFTDDSDAFKAAVYVYGANHGQFNTAWGRVDIGAARWFLNVGEIMPEAEQTRVGQVFIGAFLEATLRDDAAYRALFETPLAGREWLPPGVYLAHYWDASTQALATFAEDLDLTTATLPGGRLQGTNLSTWREQAVVMGSGRVRDKVGVYLGWTHDGDEVPSYALRLPDAFELPAEGVLTFALANLSKQREPLDLTLELTDGAGRRVSLPLSHVAALPPPLTYRMFKPPLQVSFEAEPVFSTYALPLAAFRAEDEAFDPTTLSVIRFVFDRSSAGEIILADIGLRNAPLATGRALTEEAERQSALAPDLAPGE